MNEPSAAAGSVFSNAMSNTMQWALGFPVSDGHYALTFMLIVFGGAYLFQYSAATFNARRYAWLFTAPSWAGGLFAILIGMTSALVNQPESLAESSRLVTAGLGALIAIIVVAAPLTMGLMSFSYGAAASVWVTCMIAAGIVVSGSSLIGSGLIQGKPKVLHMQGKVSVRKTRTAPPRAVTDKKRVLDEGASVLTDAKSAAIVNVRGHHVLMLPNTAIHIASTGEKPKVILEQGRIFSRAMMAGSSKMQFETRSAGFKVSSADLIIGLTRGGTAAVVAKGAMYAGNNVHDAETVVKEGNVIVMGAGGGLPTPVSDEYLADLARLTRYFENPFSAPNRALITGEKVAKKEEEKPKPKAPEPEKPKSPDEPAKEMPAEPKPDETKPVGEKEAAANAEKKE